MQDGSAGCIVVTAMNPLTRGVPPLELLPLSSFCSGLESADGSHRVALCPWNRSMNPSGLVRCEEFSAARGGSSLERVTEAQRRRI